MREIFITMQLGTKSVSYTHLDVYKRQVVPCRVLNKKHNKSFSEKRKVVCVTHITINFIVYIREYERSNFQNISTNIKYFNYVYIIIANIASTPICRQFCLKQSYY